MDHIVTNRFYNYFCAHVKKWGEKRIYVCIKTLEY